MHFLLFQHTVARRRLLIVAMFFYCLIFGFNTQPRGGGCNTAAGSIWGKLLFQHTAARRRLLTQTFKNVATQWFQHTAARRRLLDVEGGDYQVIEFQHTAARRRLHNVDKSKILTIDVSTHSRAEAAAFSQ